MTDPGGSQQPDFNKPNDYGQGGTPPPTGGGYTPPPAGGYGGDPNYGGQPGYGGAPGGGSGEDKTWILVSHFGAAGVAFISGGWLGWVPPLIAFLVQGNKSPNVRQQALGALNFQINWSALTVIIYVLSFCLGIVTGFGFLLYILVFATWLIAWIFSLIAGIKANNGEPYEYPMTFVKLVN